MVWNQAPRNRHKCVGTQADGQWRGPETEREMKETLQERSKDLPSANGHTTKQKRQKFNFEFPHEVFQHFLVKCNYAFLSFTAVCPSFHVGVYLISLELRLVFLYPTPAEHCNSIGHFCSMLPYQHPAWSSNSNP